MGKLKTFAVVKEIVIICWCVVLGIAIFVHVPYWIDGAITMITGKPDHGSGIVVAVFAALYMCWRIFRSIRKLVRVFKDPEIADTKLLYAADWVDAAIITVVLLVFGYLGGNSYIREQYAIRCVQNITFDGYTNSIKGIADKHFTEPGWTSEEIDKDDHYVYLTGYLPEVSEKVRIRFSNGITERKLGRVDWWTKVEDAYLMDSQKMMTAPEASELLKSLDK